MDDLIIKAVYVSVLVCVKHHTCKRKQKIKRKRKEIKHHFSTLIRERQFDRYYRMSRSSFEKLYNLFAPVYLRQRRRSESKNDKHVNELQNKLQLTISWLAGGHYQHVRCISKYSVGSFYRIIYEVMKAIIEIPQLKIRFPSNTTEAMKVAKGFRQRSTNGLLSGCIGAIDGWLCPIITPAEKQVGCVKDFSRDITRGWVSMCNCVVILCEDSHILL